MDRTDPDNSHYQHCVISLDGNYPIVGQKRYRSAFCLSSPQRGQIFLLIWSILTVHEELHCELAGFRVIMNKYICLKCGSHDVDDGTNYLASFIGVCLLIIGLSILVMSGLARTEAPNWLDYSPLEGQNLTMLIPIGIAICIAEIVVVDGATPSHRVRCKKCGAIWTPPHSSSKMRKGRR